MRKLCFSLSVILLALLCRAAILPYVASAQQDGPRVVIVEADPNRTIARTIRQPDFEFGLTLENQNRQKEVGDLEIGLGPLTRSDGVVEAQYVLQSAASGLPTSLVVLPPGGRGVMTISGHLPQPMQYTSWLSLSSGGRVDVYALVLTRAALLPLRIVEAGDDGRLTFGTISHQFARAITVQLPQGQPAIEQLQITVGELSREDGQPILNARLTCSVCGGKPIALKADQPITLLLQGEQLEIGTYVASLRLSYGEQTQIIPIRLTRAEPAQNLQVTPPSTVALMQDIWGRSTAAVPIVVREINGQARSIYYPILNRFELTDAEGKRFSVVITDVRKLQRDPSGTLVAMSAQPNSPTTTLPFNQDVQFVYQIRDLAHGAYTGQVMVGGPGSAKATADIAITVKNHWLWALLMLLLGVLVAYALTEWTDAGRARALRGVAITEEIEQIEQLMRRSDEEDTVWTGLRDQLRRLHRTNRWKIFGANEIDTKLADLRSRKQSYQQALAVHTQIATFIASHLTTDQESLRQSLKETFTNVQDAVREGVSQVDRDAKLQALRDLRQDVQRKAIRRPAEQLLQQVQSLAEESTEIAAAAQALRTNIQQHVIDQAAVGNIDDLLVQLRQYRREYVRLRLDQLTGLLQQLAQERRRVPQPTASHWQVVDDLMSEAREKLAQGRGSLASDQVDQALDDWEHARAGYLGALLHQLRLLIGDGRPGDIPQDDWQAILLEVPDLAPQLDSGLEYWRAGDLDQARDFYDQARAQYVTVLTKVLDYRLDAARRLSERQPALVGATEWGTLTAELVTPIIDRLRQVKRELPHSDVPAPERWSQYRAIYAKAIVVQVDLMQALYERLLRYDQQSRSSTRANPTWPSGLGEALQTLKTTLEKAQDAMPRDVTRAEQLLYDAQQMYIGLLERIRPASGEIAAGAQPPAAVRALAPTGGLAPPPGSPAPAAGAWRLSTQRLADVLVAEDNRSSGEQLQRIAIRSLLYLGLVILIAAVTGLQALWMNKATFGGADYVTAFLWGFGTLGTAAGFSAAARRYQLPGGESVHT